MSMPPVIPRSVRTPLLFVMLSGLLTPGILFWSWRIAAEEAGELAHLRQENAKSEHQLMQQHKAAASTDQALRLLVDLQPLAADDRATTVLPRGSAASWWREYPATLEDSFIHEEALLSRIEAWQARSPIQHQLRACRIERRDDGLFASCQMAALEMQR